MRNRHIGPVVSVSPPSGALWAPEQNQSSPVTKGLNVRS